jgi:hypothetical protein
VSIALVFSLNIIYCRAWATVRSVAGRVGSGRVFRVRPRARLFYCSRGCENGIICRVVLHCSGLIRAIDVTRHVFYVLTPVAPVTLPRISVFVKTPLEVPLALTHASQPRPHATSLQVTPYQSAATITHHKAAPRTHIVSRKRLGAS